MMNSRYYIQSLLCVAVLSVSAGCSLLKRDDGKLSQSWDVRRALGWKKDEPAPPQLPNRLVSTWTDTVLYRQGGKGQRGFGGRLLFFNNESDDPIRVEGQLVVYAYDENDRESHQTQPTRRYVFPAEQFALHESEAKIGPSYSVWLPWGEIGGPQKNISLIARFEPAGGPLIVGEQTRHLLPGTRMLADGKTAPPVEQISDIQLTQYSQESKIVLPASMSDKPAKSKPQITSIALGGKTWEKRLQKPQLYSSTTKETTASPVTVLPGPARQ